MDNFQVLDKWIQLKTVFHLFKLSSFSLDLLRLKIYQPVLKYFDFTIGN